MAIAILNWCFVVAQIAVVIRMRRTCFKTFLVALVLSSLQAANVNLGDHLTGAPARSWSEYFWRGFWSPLETILLIYTAAAVIEAIFVVTESSSQRWWIRVTCIGMPALIWCVTALFFVPLDAGDIYHTFLRIREFIWIGNALALSALWLFLLFRPDWRRNVPRLALRHAATFLALALSYAVIGPLRTMLDDTGWLNVQAVSRTIMIGCCAAWVFLAAGARKANGAPHAAV